MNKKDYEKLFTMSQREVAKALGLTHTHVHLLEKAAMAKIKQALEQRNINVNTLFKD